MDENKFPHLMNALYHASNLEKLNLNSNELKNEEIILFSKTLRYLTKLKSLELNNNFLFSDDGLSYLFNSFSSITDLRKLTLGGI